MKLLIDDFAKTTVKIKFLSLYCTAILIPWNTRLTNVAIVVSGIIWLLLIVKDKTSFNQRDNWFVFFLFSMIYFINVIGMVYTSNVGEGKYRLETKLALAVFPFIIIFSTYTKDQINKIINAFVVSTFLALLWCEGKAILTILELDLPLSSLFLDPLFQNLELSAALDNLHPVYLCIFICFSISFLLPIIIRKDLSKVKRLSLIIVLLFCLVFIIQLASVTGLLCLLLTLIIFALFYLKLKVRTYLLFGFFLISSLLIIIYKLPVLNARFIAAATSSSLNEDDLNNSFSLHYKAWYCSFSSWSDSKWIGHGSGDEKVMIRACFENHKWTSLNQDSHNEYLSSLIRHGLIGLILLLASLFYAMYKCLKSKDYLYANFLILIGLVFCSESVLHGGVGLYFYAFFNSLLMKRILQDRPTTPSTMQPQYE